jgi:hypothetical protein
VVEYSFADLTSNGLGSRPFVFVHRLPNCKFNIAEEFYYLYPEVVQPNCQRAAATSAIMDQLAAFFPVVVLHRDSHMTMSGFVLARYPLPDQSLIE